MSFLGFTLRDIKQTYKIYRMNLRNRYLGSRMGLFWAILNPLLMLGVYIFVFGVMMRVTVAGSTSPLDYVRWFICGFSPWMALSEGITLSCSSILSNIQLVKSFAMKSELLPISSACLGLPQLVVGLTVVILLSFITGAGISLHILWLLAVIPLMFMFLSGLAFFLSACTVFVRDILQFIGTILMALMFMSPVFTPIESMPWILQVVSPFNPIYQIVDPFRQILFYQRAPSLLGLLYLLGLTLVLWGVGLWFFRRLKGFFESAL